MNLEKLNAEEITLASAENKTKEAPKEKETTTAVKAEVATPISEPKATESTKTAREEKPRRVHEIRQRRGIDRKVFRMSDGTEQAVFYPEPIHARDPETGLLEEVDNTLCEEEDHLHFKNRRGDFTARFSNDEETGELFSVEKNGHSIAVLLRKNSKTRAKGMRPRLCKAKDDAADAKDKLIFENLTAGVDVEYAVHGNGVKENIIVREKAPVYRYPFLLDYKNLVMEHKEEERRLVFNDPETGESVFHIPAPFMTDAAGAVSHDVFYEVFETPDGHTALSVIADSSWINAKERTLPVTIDPQIITNDNYRFVTTYGVQNGMLVEAPATHILRNPEECECACDYDWKNMYFQLNLSSLPPTARVKKAELNILPHSIHISGQRPRLGLYRVPCSLEEGASAPCPEADLVDYSYMYSVTTELPSYTFDITNVVQAGIEGATAPANLALTMFDSRFSGASCVILPGTGNTFNKPTVSITYEVRSGVGTAAHTHTHDLGRLGQGMVDLQFGNLMLESEDFAWGGTRMPITLCHLYNSEFYDIPYSTNPERGLYTASFENMKMGNGWKLNMQQSVVSKPKDGAYVTGDEYVYIDENGEGTTLSLYETGIYKDADDTMTYTPSTRTLVYDDKTYTFDNAGKLAEITNNSTASKITLSYCTSKLSTIADGTGRDFALNYTNNFLTSIKAPDYSDNENSITYGYEGNYLSHIFYEDGRNVHFTYTASGKMQCVELHQGNDLLKKVEYTFAGYRVSKIQEYGALNGQAVTGNTTEFSYSLGAHRTVVTTTEPGEGNESPTVTKTVYAFDDDGNVVSQYVYTPETGNIGATENDEEGISVTKHGANLLRNHSLESVNDWSVMQASNPFTATVNSNTAHISFGIASLRMKNDSTSENGLYQSISLPAGDYTFSCYAKPTKVYSGTGFYLKVTNSSGTQLARSEAVDRAFDFVRLHISFHLESAATVHVCMMLSAQSEAYVNAPQLENNAYLNSYNMLENGNFNRSSNCWSLGGSGIELDTATSFHMQNSLRFTGNVQYEQNALQVVHPRREAGVRETFTLSGWAKGNTLPNHPRYIPDSVTGDLEEDWKQPTYRLEASIVYADNVGNELYTADFCPQTDEWQFTSVQFCKTRFAEVDRVTVSCSLDYNGSIVHFDDLCLTRDYIETGLTAADFETEESGDSTGDTTTEETTFTEATDEYGNVTTETIFAEGNTAAGALYRSFTYGNDGNDLVAETDHHGKVTSYVVDPDTSRNTQVIDRLGNKTAYEYDTAGRTTKVTAKNANNIALANVSYAYDGFDNLTSITRGDGMQYDLTYDAFRNLAAIGIRGKSEKLISYTYKQGSNRLKTATYANGDKVTLTYNSLGQVMSERWQNASGTQVFCAKFSCDGEGNIVRSIDMTGKKE
ncbi:MAG: RHS repeat protein, partial [Clostridia bacterium]|nr:RHS repeat protein [Clostridia bacterium]